MEHISNMGYSLDAIRFLVELQVAKWLPSVDIYYQETYPFCNRIEYEKEVKKYLIKHNTETLNKILTQHLSTCEQIIKAWEVERPELWEAQSLLTAGRKNDVDANILHEIYCTLGGRENNFHHFYGDILLLRINNGKVEKGNAYTWPDMSWYEYNPKLRPLSNTYIKIRAVHLVRCAVLVKRFLSKYIGRVESVETIANPQPPVEKLQTIKQPKQLLNIPPKVLTWLQETICENGRPYIEDATAPTLRWMQNKQLARELLTHDKIRGNLIKAEVERQTPNILIYHRDGKPLRLAKPDKERKQSKDSDKLSDYLATLQLTDL